ncbi:MAG: tetratricopeptide repeat protein [Cyanobacteriota bacterium]
MRSRPKHLSFISATLLLSLTSPLQLPGTNLGISSAMAAKTPRNSQTEVKKLSLESFHQPNEEQLQLDDKRLIRRRESEAQLREQLKNLEQNLSTHTENGARTREAETINKIGEICIQLKDYSKALNLHQQALAIYEELGAERSAAETVGYIGNAYFKSGQYTLAEELFRQKLESRRKTGYREGEQLIIEVMRRYLEQEWAFQAGFGIAQSRDIFNLLTKGDISWQEQLEIAQLNLFISREISEPKAQQHSLHSIGWVYRNLGRYSQALESYQQSLAIARERGIKDHEVFLLIEIGLVYSDLAQYSQALEFLEKSLDLLPSLKESGELIVPLDYLEPFAINQIGLVYKRLEQYDRALHFFQQALSKDSFETHNILNNIGLVYFKRGEYSLALEAYQKALRGGNSGDPSAPGFILNSIGLVHAKIRDYTQALETYRQALALFIELNDRPGERTTLTNIGALLEKQNQPELAIVFYKEAVNITEFIRQDLQKLTLEEQKTYTETVASTYRSLADLLLSQGRILEAQQVLELLKVQELRNFTKDTRAGGEETTGITTNSTETEILKIHGTLIALGRKIEECQQCAAPLGNW